MLTVPLKLVTIIAESVLRDRVVAAIKHLGANGYTVTEAQGEGSRHLRAGELPGENIRIETIVSPSVADRIVEHIANDYFHAYALIVFVSDVSVVRGDKYISVVPND